MTWLKKYNALTDWESAKSGLEYPSVGLIEEDMSVVYMIPPPIHALPIKAVFYDSATGSFVKMYPDEITEAIPTYTPIGVEVVPAEHDVYGTGQAGIMSIAEMNCNAPDVGGSGNTHIRWGGAEIATSLPNYDKFNLVNGTTNTAGYMPSDDATGATSLDGVSKYGYTSNNIPSPYNADGSRNEAYYTTDYSTANALSDFDGVGNTKVLTDLATNQPDWKTATTITNSGGAGYYPAACCCWRFHTAGTEQGQWYLPACGELGYVINRSKAIDETINKIKRIYSSSFSHVLVNGPYWSSSEYSDLSAMNLTKHSGNARCSVKSFDLRARAFIRL